MTADERIALFMEILKNAENETHCQLVIVDGELMIYDFEESKFYNLKTEEIEGWWMAKDVTISEAIQQIAAGIGKLGEAIAGTLNRSLKQVTETINEMATVYYTSEFQKKMQCNNWRKTHGIPMIRTSEKERRKRK